MAIAQSTFAIDRGRGYDGQVSDLNVADIVSRDVEGAMIPFGRAVVRGTGKRSCAPVSGATVAADVIGFTVRTLAEFSNSAPAIPDNYVTGYEVNHTASVLRRGPMYAVCLAGASAGDTVHVVLATGELRGAADGVNTIELTGVKWVEDVVAGEIGEIQADGILTL